MDDTSGYLNTDLESTAVEDLTALVEAFAGQDMLALQVACREDGRWYATFETSEQHEEPQTSIAAMLAVIEALPEPLQAVWSACTQREFNIGYACVSQP